MELRELLAQCREPISSEKAKRLMSEFSFDDHQNEVVDYLLLGDSTETQKYLLLDGLAGTDLSVLSVNSAQKLAEKFLGESAGVKRMMTDLLSEFAKESGRSDLPYFDLYGIRGINRVVAASR